jgi:hypothetical protein
VLFGEAFVNAGWLREEVILTANSCPEWLPSRAAAST